MRYSTVKLSLQLYYTIVTLPFKYPILSFNYRWRAVKLLLDRPKLTTSHLKLSLNYRYITGNVLVDHCYIVFKLWSEVVVI